MQKAIRSITATELLGMVVVVACWFWAFPAVAQQGQDAVYNSSAQVTNSPSFIDASQFGLSTMTICKVLYGILSSSSYPATGAVIDARGLPGTTGTNMTCATGTTPWNNGTTTVNVPSIILLPAGPITIQATWALPGNTKLIGEGYGTTGGTVIQACTTSCSAKFPTGNSMIQFGLFSCPINTPICYSGISVENLMLNGSSQNINGIQNSEAQFSYVDHVTFFQILGTGLSISAMNSGPYTNVTFDSGSSALTSTTCANITGPSNLGIRGLTCIAGNLANVAVYLDAPNNSIEDVRIAGFFDGILVGSQAATQSDVLFNIFGDSTLGPSSPSPINVIHISNQNTVTDFSIMGVNNPASPGANTIDDQLTSTTLSDPYVAMYVVGKAANGGYSRFTTSTSSQVATWGVGSFAPTNGSSCPPGSLYSNTSANPAALYVCSVNSSTWLPVK
jgi:hypothetical protein